MMTDIGFLDINGLAGFIGMSRRTIYRLASAKRIPCAKVGGQWRFDPQIIRDWITRRMLDNCKPGNATENQATD
ncbi:MAG: helix-turn-helix domain-containing protein [Planctomycetes bacterium]|nr:helix-turn-helix domain-containing protein [Planctomycetota bacterium]